ncbi:unnamed protein product [Tetraodon nigroviridis]|uniref:(spotted green pufferfish) hypothetical protein n=1 Tax=Tetraodon nigroviridis TaxID=99883 RepID=Q4SCH6_TETNG|nr:unnamed protein product [Tetraodon nigroviridis]
MAAALSRALKLPGKKGPDLGEYDPLTQADSEDESEEDDLVLNYPRNGLGRDSRPGSGSAKLLGGRAGRRAGARGEAPEDEEEEDDWRDRPTAPEYWSHGRSERDGTGEDGGGPGPLGATGVAVHGTDPEEKRRRARRAIRSAFFLVPLVCAALIVLLSAFLIPCRNANLQRRLQWERALGAAGGITSAPLALWDVNGDSLEDVIVGVTESPNGTHAPGSKGRRVGGGGAFWPCGGLIGVSGPVCSVVALSAVGGQRRVSKVTAAPVMYIQGGPRHPGQEAPAVVLISRSTMTAVDGSTGKTVWSAPLRDIESQALLLPDLDGDSVPDLLVATLPADKASDLSLSLVSGLTGMKLGRPLSFNVTAQGKLIGPLLHQTQKEAFYVLFGLGKKLRRVHGGHVTVTGNIEAISLWDVYLAATGQMPVNQSLQRKDPVLEGLRRSNSSFIHLNRYAVHKSTAETPQGAFKTSRSRLVPWRVSGRFRPLCVDLICLLFSRGAQPVDLLFPLLAGFSSSHLSLDLVSRLNSSRSDWVLVDATNALSALRPEDMFKRWTFSAGPIHSQPAPGHFNDDGVPDLFIQSSANGIMQVKENGGRVKTKRMVSEEASPPGAGCRRCERAAPLGGRVRVSPCPFGSIGRLHLSRPIGLPLLGQRTNQSAGEHHQGNGESAPGKNTLRRTNGGLNVHPNDNQVRPGVAAAEPLIRRLFLLYPAYPTVLLELLNTTDTAVSSAVSYRDRQKDATYVVVSLRPTPESQPGAWTVSSTSLRAAVAKGSAVRLQQSNQTGEPGQAGEAEAKAFRRLTFKRQV